MKVKMNAKLAIRFAILTIGLGAAFIAASGQLVPAADGGPMPMCPPGGNCKINLPPMTS